MIGSRGAGAGRGIVYPSLPNGCYDKSGDVPTWALPWQTSNTGPRDGG